MIPVNDDPSRYFAGPQRGGDDVGDGASLLDRDGIRLNESGIVESGIADGDGIGSTSIDVLKGDAIIDDLLYYVATSNRDIPVNDNGGSSTRGKSDRVNSGG